MIEKLNNQSFKSGKHKEAARRQFECFQSFLIVEIASRSCCILQNQNGSFVPSRSRMIGRIKKNEQISDKRQRGITSAEYAQCRVKSKRLCKDDMSEVVFTRGVKVRKIFSLKFHFQKEKCRGKPGNFPSH
jgi:hypothetical protein